MKRVKATSVIAGIALLVIGYVGGAYIGFPGTDSDKLKGDIGQVDAESNDPDILAMQELLMKNPDAQKQSIVSTALLSSRIDVLDSLAGAGVKATEGQPKLAAVNRYFAAMKRKTSNAKANFEALMAVNEKTVKGEKVADFEAVSNKALLSFIVLDNAISCDAAGDLLDYTRELNNSAASNAVAGWVAFCSDNAEMKGNPQDMAMWQKVYSTLSDAAKNDYAQSKKNIDRHVSKDLAQKLEKSDRNLDNIDFHRLVNNVNTNGSVVITKQWVKNNDQISKLAYSCCNQGTPAPGLRVNF